MPDEVLVPETTISEAPVAPVVPIAPVVPVAPVAPVALTPSNFMDFVPEEYRANPALKDFLSQENPAEALLSQIVNLSDLVQNNPDTIPGAEATPEQWQKWLEAHQPQDISVYGQLKPQLPAEQAHLQEFLDAGYSPKFTEKIATAAKQAAIHPKQFQVLLNAFNEVQLEAAREFHQTTAKNEQDLNTNFDTVMNNTFGAKKMEAIDIGRGVIKQVLPAELMPHVEALSNEGLAVVAALAYNMHKKYGLEDSIKPGTSTAMPTDEIGLKNMIQEAMADPAASDPWLPTHSSVNAKIQGLVAQLANVRKGR